MSKGNLFLGQARGSVGDVVFYRANGQQIARSRNRKPANPNTYKQALQRAVAASVQRLYSQGQAIFDHSFQGKKVGMENQQEFVRLNMGRLRSMFTAELNAETPAAACLARLSAPSVSVAVPFPLLQISSGTYQQNVFVYNSPSKYFQMIQPTSGETVAHYVQRVGLLANDIYTIVLMTLDNNDNAEVMYGGVSGTKYDKVYKSFFNYVQMMVKDGLSGNTSPAASAKLGDLFTIQSSVGSLDNEGLDFEFEPTNMLTLGSDDGCIGVIRSRYGEDLRSTSYLQIAGSLEYGIASPYVIDAWQNKAIVDEQDLILEGEEFASRAAGASYVSQVYVSGVPNMPYWPTAMDIQKLESQVIDGFSILVVGSGITDAALYRDSDEFVLLAVAPDGKSAQGMVTAGHATAGEYTLQINDELYGKIFEITQ